MTGRILSLVIVLLAGSEAICSADRCPVCGQDPCAQLSRPREAPIYVPPPVLAPVSAEDRSMRTFVAGIIGGFAEMKRESSKLLSQPPASLIASIDRAAASFDDFRNPKTFEQWGRAVQADAMIEIVKSVYGGTLGSAPSLHARLLSLEIDAYNNATADGPPAQSRIRQFFQLLEDSVSEVTGERSQSYFGPRFLLATHCLVPANQNSARSVREKMWQAVVAAFRDSGQYDQLLEFHRTALNRWGPAQDAGLRNSIEGLASEAQGAVGFRVLENPSGHSDQLQSGKELILNFRGAERFEIGITGKRPPGAKTPDSPDDRIVLHPDENGRNLEVFINSLVVPASVTVERARSEWNAMKLDMQRNTVRVVLNGRLLGRFAVTYQDSGGAYHTPESLTFKLSGRGQFRTCFRNRSN